MKKCPKCNMLYDGISCLHCTEEKKEPKEIPGWVFDLFGYIFRIVVIVGILYVLVRFIKWAWMR